ncbi:aldo/keto reductase [Candidatus Bathyarchaeota archaeon]|nr:aldo/keto reductase [Candidatus Bathyarchaeota archaeon]
MKTIETGEDIKIPILGLGTSGIPTNQEGVEAVRNAIEIGYSHIDTAEVYGNSETEKMIGKAIRQHNRGDLFITTKVSGDHLRYEEVHKAIDGSLIRLDTDYVDLYLIHWPDPSVPIEETMRAMVELADSGKARAIGVSNFSVNQLKGAERHSEDHKVIANQVHYSLKEQDPRTDLLPYCQRRGLVLIAYTPLEQGKLASSGFDILDEISEKYGKTPAQISLNWLIRQDNVVAIPESSNSEHQSENLGALDWDLSEQDADRLKESLK